jgi:hypothetical protein
MLLGMVAGVYAVSGKIFGRFNQNGPVFEYWQGANNNVDLWQAKDGTGFDVGFDTFGIMYKMRTPRTVDALLLFGGLIDGTSFGANPWDPIVATSPGYIQLRDLKVGPLTMSIGASWHQFFGDGYTLSTNTNATTNTDSEYAITYQKLYIDYKFVVGLGDSLVIKQYDWDLMHFEFNFGDSKFGGIGKMTNNGAQVSSYLAYIPLNALINMDRISLTISPQLIMNGSSSVDYFAAPTNKVDSSRMRVGGYARVSVGLTDWLSVYGMGGYYMTSSANFDRTEVGTITTTNTDVTSSGSAIPVFAGLVWKIAPGIKLTTGYGFQFNSSQTITKVAGVPTTNNTSGINLRYGAYDDSQPLPEYKIFGDNMMDLAFLKLGSEVKFAGNWGVGIAAAVGLNDVWTYTWLAKLQTGYNTTGVGTGTVVHSGGNNLMSFVNLMNYDRQMYIKYEDENVAIKGTISQEGNKNYIGQIGANFDNFSITSLFGMFESIDLTVKF